MRGRVEYTYHTMTLIVWSEKCKGKKDGVILSSRHFSLLNRSTTDAPLSEYLRSEQLQIDVQKNIDAEKDHRPDGWPYA